MSSRKQELGEGGGVSFEEWNTECGAGGSGLEDCWQIGAARSLIRTSCGGKARKEEDESSSHTSETL